jgi:hypothetical protein
MSYHYGIAMSGVKAGERSGAPGSLDLPGEKL